MNGGIGFSWFRLTLVDEVKHYVTIEGTLAQEQNLIANVEAEVELIGTLIEQQQEGLIKEQYLIGTLKAHEFIGLLGGDRDE